MKIKNLFALFLESANNFEGKEKDEEVLLLIRRHPFYVIVQAVYIFLMALIPFVIGVEAQSFLFSHNLVALFFFLLALWYLILWQLLFYKITMYTLDVWIVTNHRIIDSTQHGFFDRRISELHLARVQDISVETEGMIPTFFHFGDLEVQTAGTESKFKCIKIPHPEAVKGKIMEYVSHAASTYSSTPIV
ncbi:MAG: PH domain-containing protein [Candidatus Taylorbacteria bacterium]